MLKGGESVKKRIYTRPCNIFTTFFWDFSNL